MIDFGFFKSKPLSITLGVSIHSNDSLLIGMFNRKEKLKEINIEEHSKNVADKDRNANLF